MEGLPVFCVYLQLRACTTLEGLERTVVQLQALGVVGARGLQPATDSSGCWVEIKFPTAFPSVARVYEKLEILGIPRTQVARITPIRFGHGHAEARQLDLFGSK